MKDHLKASTANPVWTEESKKKVMDDWAKADREKEHSQIRRDYWESVRQEEIYTLEMELKSNGN